MSRLSEDDLIARYFAPLAGPGGLGLHDDVAVLSPPPGMELVLTKDALVAGVHFFADDPPESIARKALRVNLSDLAAKGAEPAGYLLALALPPDWTDDWLAAFARGLGDDGAAYRFPLLGGDTVKTPGPLTISVTALGFTPEGDMVPRTGVMPGDRIYVSGTIGDAALGLALRLAKPDDAGWIAALSDDARGFLRARYLEPQPRLPLRKALRAYANGGMDVSDGFVGDLTKMLRVSECGADINMAKLPLSPAARDAVRHGPHLLRALATGGDDYEIIATIPEGQCGPFEAAARIAGVDVTQVGVARAGRGVVFHDAHGRPLDFGKGSFSHF
jgi:thiamine-monophosphate kinase